ncbi:HepT-like ribonuclease domain-containing protein [Sulfurimonas sp.]|uniref:HepT-like ribonuclease domain-containing protein n=1 Tax=Sulfurimonas sp. TaxID=2022749 RepID=UPI00261B8356|nr:HepT-like ribonuclease domain-containing protein [Sulfurimonas sp.]MCW8895322.1 DUF86 domain-containing protein [Sulfurimonas sp.]
MSKNKKRDIELFIIDIFVAIQKLKEYTKEFIDEEELRYSSLHWDATIRELEIVGEALNNLLNDKGFSLLSPSYFRKIVDFRNVIVHGYFGIDASEVWNVIVGKLDILYEDLLTIVDNNIDLSEAIKYEILEYEKLKDKNIVKYLKSIS